MSLMVAEQETTINMMRNGGKAEVYTSDTTLMTKLDRMLNLADTEWKLEKEYRLTSGELIEKTYSCPKNLISFRSKTMKKRKAK